MLVELDEGIRFVANLLGVDVDDVQNGMEVDAEHRRRRRRAAPPVPARPSDGGRLMALSRETAIVGIGQTEFSKHSGRSELQLAGEAVAAAVADAGLTPADIDGAVTFAMDVNDELAVMRCAGIPSLRFTARTRGGGGGACATVQLASAAVASGAADAVVVYRAFNERSGRRFGQPISENNKSRVVPPGWNWYLPFGLDTPAKVYSLWYQRYMHRYDVTNVDFGLYPVVARKHAATNPNAFYYQQPLTLEEHQESRWIVEPILRKLDCCQESDGGVALVVTSMDRAARPAAATRCASTPPARVTCATATRCSATTAATSPATRRARSSAGSSTRPRASRPTTSTWR